MAATVLDQLDECLDWAEGVLAGIGTGRRDAPTPCPEFTVERLVGHVVDGLVWYGGLPAGGPTDPRDVHGPDLARTTYADAFRAARAVVGRNWTPHHLAERFALPFGEITGAGITEYTIIEVVGHGWDLAVSTGQPADVAPELAEAALAIARSLGEMLRYPGMMGAAVPVDADAPAIDRFVAFLGRQPA
jgi:uncharacterized protein (TIGR03086 family)